MGPKYYAYYSKAAWTWESSLNLAQFLLLFAVRDHDKVGQ